MDSHVSHYMSKSTPFIYASYPKSEPASTTTSPLSQVGQHIANEVIWNGPTVLKSIILTLIVCGTILGNGMVLLAMKFSRDKNLSSSTHYFIANLAAADFCVGVLVLPFLAALTVTGNWYFGQTYCTVWAYTHFWMCSASILSVCAVCIDRYVGVKFPLKHYRLMNRKKVFMISCGVWGTALFLSAVPLAAWPEPPSDNKYVCKINQQLGHVLVASFGILYIPAVIMLVLYGMIYYITVQHFRVLRDGLDGAKKVPQTQSQRVKIQPSYGRDSITAITTSGGSEDYSNSTSSTSADSHPTSNSNGELIPNRKQDERPERKSTFQSYINNKQDLEQDKLSQNRNRQVRVARRLALVVGAFLLSYVPFFTVFLIEALHPGTISTPVFFFFGWIRYFNSCLNPIIYAATLPAFKKSFKDILSCKLAR